jgi:hypothetical protein
VCANPHRDPDCDAVALLRSQMHQVRQLLEEHVATATELARSTPTRQLEILSLYVHALCIEDTTVNLLLRAASPMFKQVWPAGQLVPWDLTSVQRYAEVVHAATDVMLTRLTPADLRLPVNLSDVGLGTPDRIWVLNRFILWPTVMACGEIAGQRPERGRTGPRRRSLQTHAVARRDGLSNGVHTTSSASATGFASTAPSPGRA